MCNDNCCNGGILFPDFTRYACCNPCCDRSVLAERVDSDTDNNCNNCNCCCCCRCCGCGCGCGCGNNGNVGGTSDNNFRCPCRGGW